MDLQLKVLELLAENARLTTGQLATMLDMPEDEVAGLVKQLEENHTIIGYRTLVNWEKVGKEKVTALIEVKVTPERDVGFTAIAERIGRFPEVKTLHLMSGTFDLAVFIEGRTMQEVAFFVATKLAPIDGVTSTTTHFVLQTYKKEGILLEDEDGDHRLVMLP